LISSSSRYSKNTVQNLTGSDGIIRQTIMPRASVSRNLVVTDYTWRAGDRVDLLAARAYGDETLWWVMADANPQILDWTSIPVGTIVRIPLGS
jgi:nucleoid-associated protein YgaU